MPKQIEEIPLVVFKLNTTSGIPLYRQLYEIIRKSILEGRLLPGQKLPATRSLASELNISRNTAALAFNQLLIEGYINGKTGSGSYVSEIPDKPLKLETKVIQKDSAEKTSLKINHRFGSNKIIGRNKIYETLTPFRAGTPAIREFPVQTWFKMINQHARTFSHLQLGYGDAAGYRPLREAVASYLRSYRAVNCNADQIIIVNGSQQGLDLTGRVLLKPGSNVWLEDPGYYGARASMIFADAAIFPSPLDNEGLDVEYASKKNPIPDLIYTTPSHQFPLGLTMSISRRLNLLKYAAKNKCWIIEDDYDSEFRYTGDPLPSLQGMDKNNTVLYLGTFSKVLFPALRLGYLVLPYPEMLEAFTSAKAMVDRQCPVFEQAVLTKFIEEGYFTRHIRKMRVLYKQRQDFLINEIKKELDGLLDVTHSPAGMHLVGFLPENFNDKKVSEDALKNGVITEPLSDYSIKYFNKPGLILGYTAFNQKEIKNSVGRLKEVLKNV